MIERSNPGRFLRIAGTQVERGMYIHTLHCGWLQNPFWRKSFLLVRDVDRDKIRATVPHVTIDLTKGRGLTLVASRDLPDEAPVPAAPVATMIRPRCRKPQTETERAADTASRAAEAISALFGQARLGRAIRLDDLAPTVDEIALAITPGPAAMLAVTRMKDQDHYTYIHSVAVGALMMGLARHLGMSEADIRVAGMAGLLHDIGKMQIEPAILDKPGRLTSDELVRIRMHPGLGHGILLDNDDLDPRILDVCRHHHERMDGAGYPDGLKDEELSLFVRISAVCDVYDAVTSIRSYKPAWSPHEALAQMLRWEGHFAPEILRAFIASLEIQPFGALVRLHSNRLGLVVREGDCPTTPIVRTFFSVPDQQLIPPQDVATRDDPILRSERGEYWFADRWPTLQTEIMAEAAMPAPPLPRAMGM
ncbi:HD-GYP domain-containing protein [Sphingomonas sp. PB1R3]|uniref:HD-GYP domain-containing protein n=1 Tax=Sphingomonas flavida TaxID=3096154 RepID=UPI002FCC4D7E